MYNKYFQTNKRAIWNRALVTILVISVIAIGFAISWLILESSELPHLFYWASPLLVLVLVLEDNFLKFQNFKPEHQRFITEPFRSLPEIGFRKVEKNHGHWWKMSEVQFESMMNGYHLTAHSGTNYKKEFDFHISLDKVSIKKHNWPKLYKNSQGNEIELYGKGANIVVNVSDSEAKTIRELKAYLIEKIHFLIELKLDPKH